jgi:hypothetical protein
LGSAHFFFPFSGPPLLSWASPRAPSLPCGSTDRTPSSPVPVRLDPALPCLGATAGQPPSLPSPHNQGHRRGPHPLLLHVSASSQAHTPIPPPLPVQNAAKPPPFRISFPARQFELSVRVNTSSCSPTLPKCLLSAPSLEFIKIQLKSAGAPLLLPAPGDSHLRTCFSSSSRVRRVAHLHLLPSSCSITSERCAITEAPPL